MYGDISKKDVDFEFRVCYIFLPGEGQRPDSEKRVPQELQRAEEREGHGMTLTVLYFFVHEINN